MSQASVFNAIKRFKETGVHGNRKSKQNGRPRISTDRDDRFLARKSLHDRFKPVTKLNEEWEKIGVNTCFSTIWRRPRAANLTGRVVRKKPHLTIAHKRRRLDFAKKITRTGVKRNGNVFFGLTNLHSLFLENVGKDMFEDDQERNLIPNV